MVRNERSLYFLTSAAVDRLAKVCAPQCLLQPVGSQTAQCPLSAHTVPTQCPHSAHCKKWGILQSLISRLWFLISRYQESAESSCFHSGHCVGAVWALCGHCVGTVQSDCPLAAKSKDCKPKPLCGSHHVVGRPEGRPESSHQRDESFEKKCLLGTSAE